MWYQEQLSVRPVRTQAATSAILWACGDCLAQTVDISMQKRKLRSLLLDKESQMRSSNSKHVPSDIARTGGEQGLIGDPHKSSQKSNHHFNKTRVMTTGLFGLCFVGPLGHFWYQGLEHLVRHRWLLQPNTVPFIAAKVVCDTFVFGPVHLVAFFTWTGVVSGNSWVQVKQGIARDFLPALLTEGMVWPAVQIANFRFVPVQHQLLFVNAVCLLDSSWLSWLKYEEDAPWKKLLASILWQHKESKDS